MPSQKQPLRYTKLVPFLTVLLTISLLCLTPAVLAGDTKTKTLISGQGEIGDRDGANQFSLDGGLTFAPSFIVAPNGAYSTIPGAKWISFNATGDSLVCPGCGPQTTIYRTHFNLPATATNPGLTVNLFADNVGAVYVNGILVGAQPTGSCPGSCPGSNFQNPPSVFTDNNATHFQTGLNVLEFVVDDYGVVGGLNYLATVTYTVNN